MSIKLEHVVLASPEQMEFIIEGMRNPMNSWEKSDSEYLGCEIDETDLAEWFKLGKNDHSLMQCLSYAGTEHRKFMRMMPVYVRITAPLYWWKEFDTYKVGTVANSCSTMHKIQAKEFKLEDLRMNKYSKYALCLLIISVCGTILSYAMNEKILLCDIFVAINILLFQKMED